MFYRGTSLLTGLASAEALPAFRAPAALAERCREAADRAMRRDLPALKLSERLADPAGWRRAQRARRQALEALLPLEPDKAAVTRATDILCMIVEESAWSENPALAPFDDERHPEIDFQCAETAALLGWTSRCFGDALPPRVRGKLAYEVRRRVFAPFLAHGDYPFMRGQGARPLCILCDILLSAILLETDAARRAAVLKQCLRQLDDAVAARENRVDALPDAAAETGAVADLCALLRKLSRGQLDLTQVCPAPEWLDALLFPWLEGPWFADPAAGTLKPALSGAELFRIGLAAGDEALAALGARLDRAGSLPSATVTARLMDLNQAQLLAAESGRVPKLKYAATAGNRLMVSRFNGLTCALHTGGGRGNAGNLLLFADGTPVLAEVPGEASVPLIAGQAQQAEAGLALAAAGDFAVREDQEQLTVDLTHAYPVSALVRAYQRTALAMRREGVLRLVDALELAQPAPVTFRFVTPEKPAASGDALRLGPVELSWETPLRVKVIELNARFPEAASDGKPLYRIELATPQPVTHGYFGFCFSGLS